MFNKIYLYDIKIHFHSIKINLYAKIFLAEADLRRRGGGGGGVPPYFLQSLILCNHFEELQTMLFEVELITNNAPLIYVYPNTIKMCSTPNYLLFGRQLVQSSSSSTTDKINRISSHFWDRWKHKYVINLRETQRTSELNIKRGKGAQTFLGNCH